MLLFQKFREKSPINERERFLLELVELLILLLHNESCHFSWLFARLLKSVAK